MTEEKKTAAKAAAKAKAKAAPKRAAAPKAKKAKKAKTAKAAKAKAAPKKAAPPKAKAKAAPKKAAPPKAKAKAAPKKVAAKKAAPKKAAAKQAGARVATAPRASNGAAQPSPARKPVSLVTGACGFMGTHMVEMLHAAGHEVRATDLAEACKADDRDKGRFPSVLRDLGIEPISADLTKPHTLGSIAKGVDFVFHVAGLFSYSASWDALKAVNVGGTRALIRAVQAGSPGLKRFVMWGAGGVYGFRDNEGIPIREDDPPEPPNDYLKSKWRAEWEVIEAGRAGGLPYSIIRPTTVYGPRGVYGAGSLLMGSATNALPMVPANFTARIPFVHVVDVCKAALYLSGQPGAEGEIFNVNDDSKMTTVEFVKYVAALEGRSAMVIPGFLPVTAVRKFAGRLARTLQSLAALVGTSSPLEADSADYLGRDVLYDNDKLKSLGYEFTYAHAMDGIRDTLRWYHDHGWI